MHGPTGIFWANLTPFSLQYDTIAWSNGAQWRQGAAHPKSSLPYSQTFYIGNGGEYRKSFHGMPPGSVAVSRCTTVHPLHTGCTDRFGASYF